MKKFIGILTSAVLALFIAFGSGCSLLPTEEELLPPKLVSAAPLTYTTITVEKTTFINQIKQDATFRTYDSVSAAFPVSGILLSRNVEINKKVSKGDLIGVLLESTDYKLQLSTMQRDANNLKIKLETAEINAAGGGEVALLKLKLEQEQYNLSVVEGGGKLADGTSLEGQKLKVQIAQQTYDNAIETAKNEYAVSKSNYDLAMSELAAIQAKYDACFLYAPITGTCTWAVTTPPGSGISANADFATFTPNKSIVLAYSSGKDVSAFVKVGTEMTVTLDGVDYVGTVTHTPETITVNTGVKYMYFLTVKGLNMSDTKLIGKSAKVSLLIEKHEDTFAVDTYLLISDGGKNYLTLLKDNIPVNTEVTLGLTNDTQTEIVSGLSVGDQIIIG